MKKPAFSFKAAFNAAARTRALSVTKLLPSMHWAFLGLGKKKAAAPPSAPSAATARQPAAKKTAPAAPAPAARKTDDEDEEMFGAGPIVDARRRERARCDAIIRSPAGLKNPVLAQTIALTSTMTRKEAIALLESTPAAAIVDRRNQSRADRNPQIGAGMAESSGGPQAGATRMHGALAAEVARTNAARGGSVQAEGEGRGQVA